MPGASFDNRRNRSAASAVNWCFVPLAYVLLFALTTGTVLATSPDTTAEDPPTIGPAPDTEPQDLAYMFGVFERFDDTYALRQGGVSVSADDWISIATRLAERTTGQILLHPEDGGQFAVRAALIKGQCHLFASIDLFYKQDPRFSEQYRLGIEHLIWVLRATEGVRLSNPEIDYLPDYSSMRHIHRANTLHPRAGFETIGTGFGGLLRDTRDRANPVTIQRRMTHMVETYSTLQEYLDALAQPHGHIRQIGSSEVARELLNAFCPWGVEVYSALADAGLTDNLDFRILPPYWGKDPSMVEQFIEVVSTEVSAAYEAWFSADGGSVSYDAQPLVSSLSLEETTVPNRISEAMHRIIGSQADSGQGRGPTASDGVLGTLGTRPIHWRWVGEPTYNIWYVSPAVFKWQPSDYMWLWFTAVKVYFGGAVGVAADEFINKFGEYVSTTYGEGPVNVPVITKFVLKEYDSGFLMPSVIEKGEWLTPAAIARKVGTPVLGAIEQQTREGLFQGIDMRNHTLGIAYDGNDIPAVMIRGDVLGFPEVAEDEYPQTLNAVRFFLAYPEFPGSREPLQKYDLSRQPPPILTFDSIGWWLLPDSLGSIDIVNSFAPPRQELVFRLTAESAGSIETSDNVKAEVWTMTPGTQQQCAEAAINGRHAEFRFILHNASDPGALAVYRGLKERARGTDYVDRAWAEAQHGRFHELVQPKTQYVLKITAGGKLLREYAINLDLGRERQRAITGRLTSLDDGGVELQFEPAIEIVKLKVSEPEVIPSDATE